jgi:hypothetical protein
MSRDDHPGRDRIYDVTVIVTTHAGLGRPHAACPCSTL